METELLKRPAKSASPFKNKVFLIIFIIVLLNYSASSLLGITLPKFADELGSNSQSIGLLVGIYAMCALLVRPVSGQIADNENKIWVLRFSLFALLVSFVGFTQANNVWVMLAFRALNGAAWGIFSTLSLTLATYCFDSSNMTGGIGLYGMAQTTASIIIPLFALPLAYKIGYNNLYYINVALMVACIFLTLFLKLDISRPKRRRYSFNLKEIFHLPAMAPTVLEFCNAVAKSSVMAFVVIFAGTLDILNIGIYFTVQAIAIFIFRPIISKLADKTGSLKTLIPCEIAAVAAVTVVSLAHSIPVILIGACFMGFSIAGHEPIIMAECANSAGKKKRGAANNTFFLGIDLGNFTGSFFAGILVAAVGYRNMFLIMGIPVFLFSIFYVFYYIKKSKNTKSP